MMGIGAVVGAGLVLAMATPAIGQLWNVNADFSADNGNPNGAWSYGWMTTSFADFTLFTNHANDAPGGGPRWIGWAGDGTPGMWRNHSQSVAYGVAPGQLSLHPGPGTEPCIARWTAPAGVGENARVTGRFYPGDGGTMQVAVRHNGSPVWTMADQGEFDLTLATFPGDTVDFAVYGGYYFGNTPLEATITADLCPADFDGDGFVTGLDFDAFVAAFEAGEPEADFDGDGFITGLDFDAFVLAFEAGC